MLNQDNFKHLIILVGQEGSCKDFFFETLTNKNTEPNLLQFLLPYEIKNSKSLQILNTPNIDVAKDNVLEFFCIINQFCQVYKFRIAQFIFCTGTDQTGKELTDKIIEVTSKFQHFDNQSGITFITYKSNTYQKYQKENFLHVNDLTMFKLNDWFLANQSRFEQKYCLLTPTECNYMITNTKSLQIYKLSYLWIEEIKKDKYIENIFDFFSFIKGDESNNLIQKEFSEITNQSDFSWNLYLLEFKVSLQAQLIAIRQLIKEQLAIPLAENMINYCSNQGRLTYKIHKLIHSIALKNFRLISLQYPDEQFQCCACNFHNSERNLSDFIIELIVNKSVACLHDILIKKGSVSTRSNFRLSEPQNNNIQTIVSSWKKGSPLQIKKNYYSKPSSLQRNNENQIIRDSSLEIHKRQDFQKQKIIIKEENNTSQSQIITLPPLQNDFICCHENHKGEQIIGLCLNLACSSKSQYCHQCYTLVHESHIKDDCKSFNQITQMIADNKLILQDYQQKMQETFKKVQQIYNDLNKFLKTEEDKLSVLEQNLLDKDYKLVIDNIQTIKEWENCQNQELQIGDKLNKFRKFIEGLENLNAQFQQKSFAIIEQKQNNELNIQVLSGSSQQTEPDKLQNLSDFLLQGQKLKSQGLLSEALKLYDKALKVEKRAEIYLQKGNILLEMQRKYEAFKQFEKAIKLDPLYHEAYLSKINVLRDQNRFKEAQNLEKKLFLNIKQHFENQEKIIEELKDQLLKCQGKI